MASQPAVATAQLIWVIYGVVPLPALGIGVHEAIVYGMGKPTWFVRCLIAVHLQFLFGLMIMSSFAPISLAEERVRGSLDVLMATPLSTLVRSFGANGWGPTVLCSGWRSFRGLHR